MVLFQYLYDFNEVMDKKQSKVKQSKSICPKNKNCEALKSLQFEMLSISKE